MEDTFNADIILNLEESYRNSVRNSCALHSVPNGYDAVRLVFMLWLHALSFKSNYNGVHYNFLFLLSVFFFFLKTSSYCEAHTGLEFMVLLPQLPRVGILAYAALCYHELLPCVFLKAGHSLHSSAQAMAQCCQQPTG